jgi:hypothetical protein
VFRFGSKGPIRPPRQPRTSVLKSAVEWQIGRAKRGRPRDKSNGQIHLLAAQGGPEDLGFKMPF